MMQETMEKRANRTVGKSRQKDFFAVLLFFFLLPYTCSSVVRAGQEKTALVAGFILAFDGTGA